MFIFLENYKVLPSRWRISIGYLEPYWRIWLPLNRVLLEGFKVPDKIIIMDNILSHIEKSVMLNGNHLNTTMLLELIESEIKN
ncbi:MAG: hypothetical protein ACOC1K_02215 [Nanoarchaeota archaeon]